MLHSVYRIWQRLKKQIFETEKKKLNDFACKYIEKLDVIQMYRAKNAMLVLTSYSVSS